MEENIRKWIEDNIAQGYTPQQLRMSLEQGGYDPHLIDEYLGFSQTREAAIPQRPHSDTASIFAMSFTLFALLLLTLSSFLGWMSYETPAETGSVKGIETPFGKAILFLSTSSLVLAVSSKILNRKFALGIIALAIVAIGMVVISIFTQEGAISSTKEIAIVKGSGISANYSVSTGVGSYVALIASLMSLSGGVLSYMRQKA